MPASSRVQPRATSGGLEVGHEGADVVDHVHLGVVGVADDDGVQPVSRCAPLVLLHVPRRQVLGQHSLVELVLEVDDEAVDQRRDRDDVLQPGEPVTGPHLDRPEQRRGPDVPPQLAGVVDHARREHVVQVGAVLRPRLELEGQARGRQLLEQHRAVARVPGVGTRPVRRGGRQCGEVRVVGQQRVDQRPHLRRRPDADVHVHAEDHHLPAPPLGAVHQGRVAVTVGDLLVLPPRERVRPAPVEQHVELARRGLHPPEAVGEVGTGLLRVRADAGDDLDRVAQQLLGHRRPRAGRPGVAARLGAVREREQLVGPGHEVERHGVEQAELPLDPEGPPLGGREGDVGGVGARVGHGPLEGWSGGEPVLRA